MSLAHSICMIFVSDVVMSYVPIVVTFSIWKHVWCLPVSDHITIYPMLYTAFAHVPFSILNWFQLFKLSIMYIPYPHQRVCAFCIIVVRAAYDFSFPFFTSCLIILYSLFHFCFGIHTCLLFFRCLIHTKTYWFFLFHVSNHHSLQFGFVFTIASKQIFCRILLYIKYTFLLREGDVIRNNWNQFKDL